MFHKKNGLKIRHTLLMNFTLAISHFLFNFSFKYIYTSLYNIMSLICQNLQNIVDLLVIFRRLIFLDFIVFLINKYIKIFLVSHKAILVIKIKC